MAEHTIDSGTFAGWRLRIRAGEAQAIGGELAKWTAAPLRKLAREYAVGEGPWPWLLEHGIRRPQPSGPSGPTVTDASRAASGMRRVNIWLSAEEAAALEQRRKGRSVRDTIGALLLGK